MPDDQVTALVGGPGADTDVLLCSGDMVSAWGMVSTANQRLIAAAPDLLAALKGAREGVVEAHAYNPCPECADDGDDPPQSCALLSRIDAAIAKAGAAAPSADGAALPVGEEDR